VSGVEQLIQLLGEKTGGAPRDTSPNSFTSSSAEVALGDGKYIYLEEARSVNEMLTGYRLTFCQISDAVPEELSEKEEERIKRHFSDSVGGDDICYSVITQIGAPYSQEVLDFDSPDWADKRMQKGVRCLWVDVSFRPADLGVVSPHISAFKKASQEFSL
jgi:hypothetical protein